MAADLSLLVNPVVSPVGGTATPYLVRFFRISSFTAVILFPDRAKCRSLERGAMAGGREDSRFPVMSRVVKELDKGDRLLAAKPVNFED